MAILPQLFMVSKTGEAESITSHYLFALGAYRALYILNWIYRYYIEGFYDLIAIIAGVIQTILYCDFFYLYITKGERSFFVVTSFSPFMNCVISIYTFEIKFKLKTNFCREFRIRYRRTKKAQFCLVQYIPFFYKSLC